MIMNMFCTERFSVSSKLSMPGAVPQGKLHLMSLTLLCFYMKKEKLFDIPCFLLNLKAPLGVISVVKRDSKYYFYLDFQNNNL